jgi:hypothetical protein
MLIKPFKILFRMMVSRQKKMRKRRPPMPALNRPGVGVIKLFSSFLIGGRV